MRGDSDLQMDALYDISEALGYGRSLDGIDAYNEACISSPREVLDRIYELKP